MRRAALTHPTSSGGPLTAHPYPVTGSCHPASLAGKAARITRTSAGTIPEKPGPNAVATANRPVSSSVARNSASAIAWQVEPARMERRPAPSAPRQPAPVSAIIASSDASKRAMISPTTASDIAVEVASAALGVGNSPLISIAV